MSTQVQECSNLRMINSVAPEIASARGRSSCGGDCPCMPYNAGTADTKWDTVEKPVIDHHLQWALMRQALYSMLPPRGSMLGRGDNWGSEQGYRRRDREKSFTEWRKKWINSEGKWWRTEGKSMKVEKGNLTRRRFGSETPTVYIYHVPEEAPQLSSSGKLP
jgi:hypothetical protein